DYLAGRLEDRWFWQGTKGPKFDLPLPALAGACQVNNAAGVLMVVEQLAKCMPGRVTFNENVLSRGLEKVRLPGRFQVLPGTPTRILDVAHNPQAAQVLAENLSTMACRGKTLAVLAMLGDKDIPGVVSHFRGKVDQWYLASLHTTRGAKAEELEAELVGQHTQIFEDPGSAYRAACNDADEQDRVVVFGSFYTVAAALSQAV
ncbi:glutamate ligase domain-containing protein, partial [Kaarinaea lacus]